MRQLENLHRAIVTADATAATNDILLHPRLSPAEQIGIYITAYRLRLAAAVTSDLPCLRDYLGAAPMAHLVDAYIDATPPRSYNLDFYSFGFADFVHNKIPPPAAALAKLEGTIAEIFMRPDSPALTANALRNCDQATLGTRTFRTRTASRLLHLSHDAETYWQNYKRGTPAPELAPTPVYLYVCRHHHDVMRHRLEPAAYALLQELIAGNNFDTAIAHVVGRGIMTESALAQHIGVWLHHWLESGFFQA